MDDSDQCIEEEGGEIRSRAQDRAEQLQVNTTEQGRIPFLGLQEWSGDPVCVCVWVAFARGRVVGWGFCKLWLWSEHRHQGALDKGLTVTVGANA